MSITSTFRHKILLQTDAPFLHTGLANSGKALMNWLAKRGKYDLMYLGSQSGEADPNHARMPYKSFGAAPEDAKEWSEIAKNPYLLRQAMYGSWAIDRIMREHKPTIWIGSNDPWAFHNQYYDADWFKKINSVLHLTIDSLPITSIALDQAKKTKYCLGWTEFAAREMRKCGPEYSHVDFIYGASDTSLFKPISQGEKDDLRKKFGLSKDDVVFVFVSRNQLRKSFVAVLEAFAKFKSDNPATKAKLLLHTDWEDQKKQGWDIPKMVKFYKIDPRNVLCTYFCVKCGQWEVKPYSGEKQNCRFCGAEKSQVTVNGTQVGIPANEMKFIYGIADAGINAMTSGGLELNSVQTLLCGLPLAMTNYSCGEDFCAQPFVYPIKWNPTAEHQSTFIKAASDIDSIKGYFEKICAAKESERKSIGEQGRNWAESVFSPDAVGAKWEKLFDSMPAPNWSSVTVEYKRKNEEAVMPTIENDGEWVRALYREILLVEPDPEGFKTWTNNLLNGMSREQIYQFFLRVARNDNEKNLPKSDLSVLFKDSNDKGRKKVLLTIKGGDTEVFIATALFEGLCATYPDADLYVSCENRFHEILAGNRFVHKALPPFAMNDNEIEMLKYVDYYHRVDKELIGVSRVNRLNVTV